jgi:aspartyl-tRNA(Asn)/glutamyl-tRNA(Gln) amidotransferase subunit A
MTEALADLSVAELMRALRARETSAVAVLGACLDRIRALDEGVHAFTSITPEAALDAARAADAALARGGAGALAGVPVAVKDLFAVRGSRRGNGSLAFAGDGPEPADATAVARLRAAGAVIVGTTHMHELAFGPTGVNPALGTSANPWAGGRVPGGSSSGSGAAVAARLVPAALGSDTGGSIRIPASFCGVSGLKPTYGRVSRAGATPLAWTLDHVGPLARSAEDLAFLLQVLAGHDPADPASAPVPVPDYAAGLDRPLRGLRIGVPRHFALAAVDADVGRCFAAALAALRAAGVTVDDVTLPALEHAGPALAAVLLSEATTALRSVLGPRLERVSVEVRVYLELGKTVSAQTYLMAQRLRTRLYEEARAVLSRVDLLALPTTALAAPHAEALQVRLGESEMGTIEAISRLTGPFNLTGLPALTVPCGFTSEQLPVGLQLVGRPFAEADVLAAGHAYQRATDWHRRRPPL